ncbi:unnamed protein product [Linum trigynum]|uniref:Uncharacterized protein n=1 Tax=Linum trigynum TaxID=586398 RepID=A0AAV2E0I6_9ROSI
MEGLLVDAAGTRDVLVFVEAVEVEDGLVGDNEEPDLFQGLSKDAEDIGDEVEQPRGVEDDYLDVEEGSADSSDEASRETNSRVSNVFNEEHEERYADLPDYNPDCDHEEFFFKIGLKFLSVEQFRGAIYKHTLLLFGQMLHVQGVMEVGGSLNARMKLVIGGYMLSGGEMVQVSWLGG